MTDHSKPELVAREISCDQSGRPVYSFCTLVTNPDEYRNMVDAFQNKGFIPVDCEFLYIDNSRENKYDGFSGYNRFLQESRGQYVVLLHQDLMPIEDDRSKLDEQLARLTSIDPTWALCGNAGALEDNKVAFRLSDPLLGSEEEGGPFPVRVMSLDENFIIVRRQANLAASRDLAGFHWYGTDLCLIADVLGWGAYVIDFHLRHKSGGYQDKTYREIRKELARKYRRAFRSRWYYAIGTQTHRPTFIGGSFLSLWTSIKWRLPIPIILSLSIRRVRRRSRRLLEKVIRTVQRSSFQNVK